MNSKTGIIVRREYLCNVRKKSFLLMTVLTPLMFIALIFISHRLSSTSAYQEIPEASTGFIFPLLIYIFIFSYGGIVMNSVREEKSNRIVEIIISSVKPYELMMGKIIAAGLQGISQFLLWIAIIAALIPDGLSIRGIDTETVIYFLIFFIGGYLLYASIFASIGAIVNTQEDTQQYVIPVTLTLLAAFLVAMYGTANPGSDLVVWTSFIPFSSPVVMMMRMSFETPLWQKLLSAVLLYATSWLFIRLSAKIYRTNILMYGKKPTFALHNS
ncbi:MAG: ABC transporter permease [Dysgonamonadaceae bacterium]|jgi:ABC-2 type transport system permease protein|nr:ABC transporter permease [Dysgonamonadaceae bacterium]